MSTPTGEKVSVKDLLWRLPAIGFCVWLAVSCSVAVDKVPSFGAAAALFISAMFWAASAGTLVKASVSFSMTSKDKE